MRSSFSRRISAAVVVAVVILPFGDLADAIAMPALAGLLMVIGVRTFKPTGAGWSGAPEETRRSSPFS